jgi:ribokinase
LKSNHSAIILGDINNDIILHINEHPIEGNESIVTTSSIRVGGSACNTAVLLAKLGLNTQLVGHIAKDPLGQVALDSISGTGLDCSLVKKYDNQTSGFITITVTPGGQRTMYSYRGCNAIPYDIETIKQQIGKKGILHISGYTFLEINQFDSILEIVKIAKERHILISLDPGVQAIKSVPQRFFQILPFIDLLLIIGDFVPRWINISRHSRPMGKRNKNNYPKTRRKRKCLFHFFFTTFRPNSKSRTSN